METNNKFEKHTFKSFLENYQIIIPMVQRDYAQGRITADVKRIRNRFLDAIKNALNSGESLKLDFVYGEIEKVYSKSHAGMIDRVIVTPLDGQQRLTTLFLLHWYAAVKCNIPEKDFAFLNKFTYDIRPSSRDFCKHLMKYTPDPAMSFEEQLKDQSWFMGGWSNDPTIASMLIMLDAIKEKFYDVPYLWQVLTGKNELIIFYFLPLAENGFSDELYIKMNSRGKKLTPFEHFKAEYEDLYERDSEEARIIAHKFDVEWMDILFTYRNKKNNLVDSEFMKYFFYISHILCYKQELPKSDDEFELINLVYKDSVNAAENRKYLENALDCWCRVLKKYKTIDVFFSTYLSNSSFEEGKVAAFKKSQEYCSNQNFFCACIKLYKENNPLFSYSDFLFLFGIITYLMNEGKIVEKDFIKRLRILRNLIWNSSSGEIRGEADYMKDLLEKVEILILTGNIDQNKTHGFNGLQENEEIEKQKIAMTPEDLEKCHKFEDHPLILGYISGLKYENLDLAETFISLFSNSPDLLKIHRAMLAIRDYRQNDTERYYMGNANESTWKNLLHKSRIRKNFDEKTMPALRELLKCIKDGKELDHIIDNYLSEMEKVNYYDWRYYFVKYPAMLRGSDGELKWGKDCEYDCTTLNKHQFNGQHWNPFLNVIYQTLHEKYDNKILTLGNYGEKLNILVPFASLDTTHTGFIYYHQDTSESWDVIQENAVDTEDRVKMALEKLEKILSVSLY